MKDMCKNCQYFVVNEPVQEARVSLMQGVVYNQAPPTKVKTGICIRYPQEVMKREDSSCGEWKDS